MGVYDFLSNKYVVGIAAFAIGAVCGYYVVTKLMGTKDGAKDSTGEENGEPPVY